MREYGKIVAIEGPQPFGSGLAADAPIGSTTLMLYDVFDFSDFGGALQIGTEILAYTARDVTAATLTLFAPTTVAHSGDDEVIALPQAERYVAHVALEGQDDDPVLADVNQSLKTLLPVGVRDTGTEEMVELSDAGDTWAVVDVLSAPVSVDGSYIGDRTIQAVQIVENTITTTELVSVLDSLTITQRDTLTDALTVVRAGAAYTSNLFVLKTETGTNLLLIDAAGLLRAFNGIRMAGSAITWSTLLGAGDLRAARDAAAVLKVDDNAGGPATLAVDRLRVGHDTTANRPTLGTGDAVTMWWDDTLGIPIWWNGSNWVNASGVTV